MFQKENARKLLFVDIAKSTGMLAAILTGIKVLGFVEKQVLAYYFGTGDTLDAYLTGFTLMVVFWDILRGLLAPSYLPTLIEYRSEAGERKSWEFTFTVLNLLSLLFVIVIAVSFLFSAQLITLAAPGFQGERLKMTVELTRLMLSGAVFFGLALITGFTLNSYKRFFLAIADDLVFKVAGLLGLVLLVRYIGIYGLAWGIALGSWLAPCLHLIGLRKYLCFYSPRIDLRLAPLKKMFRLILPLVAGTLCAEGRRVIDNWFASFLAAGSISALSFAYKLIEFAFKSLAVPLATVVFPYFSDLALQKDHTTLNDTLMTTLRMVALAFTPLAVCLLSLRTPVVRLLFERGAFDAASTQLTVSAVTFYAMGLTSVALDLILMRAYYSFSDTLTPSVTEVLTLLIHVGTIFLLRNVLGHGSIALAFSLSKTVKVIVLFLWLPKHQVHIQAGRNLRFLGKIGLAAFSMYSAITVYAEGFIRLLGASSYFLQALLIVSGALIGVGVFFILTFLLHIQEVRDLAQTAVRMAKGEAKERFYARQDTDH
ncbi:murein biosynthesis integral membrane protein MurJ [candidate division KSB3 bacterium]|uniref:Probable lipid II flippase MurJ n=1 Tax=candidate division KSB3 bacterium TaxID=2044937 RepID=A0A2G6E5C0_9BACT|nr:MAG: murein biosynthesis integral membrane protein MurJ [candidate division KSB3 bacterium]PIE29725.1 MAG: murein biosynthesis integral membrane protein MurJ [candidate division KSB3 bacterium]